MQNILKPIWHKKIETAKRVRGRIEKVSRRRHRARPAVGTQPRSLARIAEMALAHEVGSEVERAYRRGDALDKRRKLMEQWSAYLTGTKPKANRQRAVRSSATGATLKPTLKRGRGCPRSAKNAPE